jgi:hypothetical protein
MCEDYMSEKSCEYCMNRRCEYSAFAKAHGVDNSEDDYPCDDGFEDGGY